MIITHSEIQDRRVAVVEIDGPLESRSSPDFEGYINQLLGKKIIFILFDAKKMQYVSSEGIGLLLLLQKKIAEANGFFILFSLADETATLFGLLGFDKVFRIAESRADALQIMDRQIELRERGDAVGTEAAPAAIREPEPSPPAAPAGINEPSPSVSAAADSGTRVVECSNCKTRIRVYSDGDYLCPHCKNSFSVMSRDLQQTPEKQPAATPGAASLIVECARCKSLLRISRGGTYRCPDCNTPFTVSEDLSVKF